MPKVTQLTGYRSRIQFRALECPGLCSELLHHMAFLTGELRETELSFQMHEEAQSKEQRNPCRNLKIIRLSLRCEDFPLVWSVLFSQQPGRIDKAEALGSSPVPWLLST